MNLASDDRTDTNPQFDTHRAKLLCLAVGTGTVVLLVLATKYQDAREDARSSNCRGQLKQFGTALFQYHEQHGYLPPSATFGENGLPMHSWRALILPHSSTQSGQLYRNYKLEIPWNHPDNRTVADASPSGDWYWCPVGINMGHTTNYVAVIGPSTAWRADRAISLNDITDPLDETILVLEIADAGIKWCEPRDVQFDDVINRRYHANHPTHFNALFADLSVRMIRSDADLRPLLTIDSGDRPEPSWQWHK